MSEKPKTGFYAKKPHQNAPAFIKAKVSVKVEDAIAYLRASVNSFGYVNFDLKESKDGENLYLDLDNFVPRSTEAP